EKRKWVEEKRKVRGGAEASPGARSGRTIQRKARGRLAPSTAAASSSCAGTSWRKPVRSQITSGRAKEVLARMRASHVSRSPSARRRRERAHTGAMWGKAAPPTVGRRHSPLPGAGSRDRPYAPKTHGDSATRVDSAPTP